MDYKQLWARESRALVCRLPLLNEDELGLFDFHVKETQDLIDQMTREVSQHTQQQFNAEDDCAGDGWIAVDYFVKRTRRGQVIHLTSLVEALLTKACDRLEVAVGKQNIIFGLNELSGEKLTKRRKFLERFGGFSIPNDIWGKIEDMVSIRNIVIHENGEVKSGANKSFPSLSGVSVVQGELVIDESAIENCSTAVRALNDHLERSLREVAARSLAPRPILGA